MWNNKTIWIIGASRGIGAALAQMLHQKGAFVVLSSRDQKSLLEIQSTLSNPKRSSIIPIDLTNESSIQEGIQLFNSQHSQCDIVIHCGGISQRALSVETSIEVTRKIFESNFFGHIRLTQSVLPGMVQKKSGKIIVISSLTGKWGFYLRSSYAASKHALHGYYDSVRMEVEKDNVQVHMVTPGFIATDISKHALNSNGEADGAMDSHQAQGISAKDCAEQIIKGVEQNKIEFGVGGKELFSLFLHRYFPHLFRKILKRQSAR